MNKRLNLIVIGKVQGVFYRVKAKEKAEELVLTGWVRNNEDSTVKIVAEGEKENLEKLVEWCKEGSSLAKVSDIVVDWSEYQGEFDKFEIKY